MDDITTQFEEVLRRHLRSAKTDSIDYDKELAQFGLYSMTAVALLLDMEKTFQIRFPDDMLVEGTFRTAGRLRDSVQMLREKQAAYWTLHEWLSKREINIMIFKSLLNSQTA